MDKWADYAISAVRYDRHDFLIDKLKVHIDKGDFFGAGETWTREKAMSKMLEGKTFTVIKTDNNGDWQKGKDVKIITLNGHQFLRNDSENREADKIEIHFLII